YIYIFIIFIYYLFFYILIILKCKTIFYATCHLSEEFLSLMWTLYGASKGPFY
ncbi:unnamed protein product, partial [Brassica rapa subsp. trilocularis]